jgi:hypothetical protein
MVIYINGHVKNDINVNDTLSSTPIMKRPFKVKTFKNAIGMNGN